MHRRGRAHPGVEQRGPALVGAARKTWEWDDQPTGRPPVLVDGALTVAADATLYYRRALVDALGGETAGVTPERSASELIAAAYRRWGPDAVARLEGDFAFVLWDAERHTLVAARDFAGFRPLYWADLPGGVGVASTPGALLELGADSDLDLATVAAAAGGLHRAAGPETVYRGIRAVPAAHTLVWTSAQGVRLASHWSPPRWGAAPELPFEEAAQHLRALIADAVAERLSPTGATSCPLSGGWDSTAVFVIGEALLSERSSEQRLAPLSLTYPEGDPGREDETIRQTLQRWDAQTRWLDVEEIRLFDDLEERVAMQDLPFTHLYEHWNRALARGARAEDSRVQFSGYGGDQLFQVSNVYVAELVRRGRLGRAWKEWTLKGENSRKEFVRMGLVPLLPEPWFRLLTRLRGGRPLHRYLDRWIPTWFDPGLVEGLRLREREAERLPSAYPGTPAEQEWRWFVQDPYFPMVGGLVADFALEEGVEARAPLYDRRIVEFAASRPWTDLSLGRETKRLLRAACRGLAPDAVLAPRPYRTGVTSAYAERQIRLAFPGLLRRLLERPLALEGLGIIRAEPFRQACAPLLEERGIPNIQDVMAIYYTLQTELWLRSQGRPGSA
ncbi:MAG: asparagine synthase-related protein [Gemmatimonadota bacterium]